MAAQAGPAIDAKFQRRVLGQPANPNAGHAIRGDGTCARDGANGSFGHLTHTLSANTFWDVRVGRFVYLRDDDPSTGDATAPSRFDQVTRIQRQSAADRHLTLIRTTAKATLSHYQRGLFAADHEWKIGTQVEKGEHEQPQIIPGGVRFVDNNGKPFQAIPRLLPLRRPIRHDCRIRERCADNRRAFDDQRGVRLDHSRAISQDLDAIDADARETGGIIPAQARCTPGTSCRHAWASPRSSPRMAGRSFGGATDGSTKAC